MLFFGGSVHPTTTHWMLNPRESRVKCEVVPWCKCVFNVFEDGENCFFSGLHSGKDKNTILNR